MAEKAMNTNRIWWTFALSRSLALMKSLFQHNDWFSCHFDSTQFFLEGMPYTQCLCLKSLTGLVLYISSKVDVPVALYIDLSAEVSNGIPAGNDQTQGDERRFVSLLFHIFFFSFSFCRSAGTINPNLSEELFLAGRIRSTSITHTGYIFNKVLRK